MAKTRTVTELFSNVKLGTKFIHKQTGKTYALMRFTNPKTLKGTLYLYDRESDVRVMETRKSDWDQQ